MKKFPIVIFNRFFTHVLNYTLCCVLHFRVEVNVHKLYGKGHFLSGHYPFLTVQCIDNYINLFNILKYE